MLSRVLTRALTRVLARALASCLVLLLAGCAAASGSPVPSPPAARTVTVGDAELRPAVRALAVLRRWDERRAAAYAASEPRRLRRLYAPGSRAGARDVRLLRAYAERGLVVDELTVQVLDVRLVSTGPASVRLRVVDRLAGAEVRPVGGRGGAASLPVSRPTARVVTLVDGARGWVVRSVRRS